MNAITTNDNGESVPTLEHTITADGDRPRCGDYGAHEDCQPETLAAGGDAVSPRREWRDAAACRDEPPELFFPIATSGPGYEAQVVAARAVCARCPVRSECLTEAFERIPEGIAGGLTAEERRDLARRHSGPSRPGGSKPAARARAAAEVAAGRRCRAVAVEHGVSERTVQRWARGGGAP